MNIKIFKFVIFYSFAPSLLLADPMCRLSDYDNYVCHIAWLIYAAVQTIPLGLPVIIINFILKKTSVIKTNRSVLHLSVIPIIFTLFFCYIEEILISDLTIYDNNWVIFRDFIMIPFIALMVVWLITFFILRKKEAESNGKH